VLPNGEDDFVHLPPDPAFRAKRDRFCAAAAGRHKLLEVGVNGGHSAYLALTANPDLEFHGIDICQHPYVIPAVTWLQEQFPGRVLFTEGSSLDVVPDMVRRGDRYDAFHIHGPKGAYYHDIVHCTAW